jgi:hypothetical protein
MVDYANCIQIQNALAVSGTEGRTVVCPAPPKCYSVAQGPAPVNPLLPAPPPAVIPPALTTCACGTGTVANGEFCGSYYQGSFGFFYTPIIASSVYVCRDGELVLQSDTNPTDPLAAPARVDPPPSNIRDGTFRKLSPIGGNRYVEP